MGFGIPDVLGDVADALNPIDEIVDFAGNVADGDVIGAVGNVIDASTPLDEIFSAGNHLLGGGSGGGVSSGGGIHRRAGGSLR